MRPLLHKRLWFYSTVTLFDTCQSECRHFWIWKHSLHIRIPPCSCFTEKILYHDSYCSCSFEIRSLSWMKHPSKPVDSHIETPFFALKGWNTLKLLYSQAICFRFVSEAAFDSNISSYLLVNYIMDRLLKSQTATSEHPHSSLIFDYSTPDAV